MSERGNSLCEARIREHYAILSNQEKKVADMILADCRRLVDMTSAKLAAEAGVSEATIVRFCRSIGFKGYTDFKLYLAGQFTGPVEYWSALSEDDSLSDICQKVFLYNKSAMNDTLLVLDQDAINRAVDAILGAKRIFVFSGGGAMSSAWCLTDAFIQIGIPCQMVNDPLLQVMNAGMLTSDDLAIGISHSGQTRVVIEAMKAAYEAGAQTLSIVGLVGSPITKYARIVLHTGLAEQSFFSKTITSRLCELQVISTLYSCIYVKRSKQIIEHQKRMNEIIEPMFTRK